MAMSNKARQMLFTYLEQKCGAPLNALPPRQVSGGTIVEALWPLNEHFRPNFAQIRVVPYGERFANSADKAIERFVTTGQWGAVSVEAWRVLLERHTQALSMCMLIGSDPMMSVPESLPDSELLVPVMLFLLHGMKLPFPVENRAGMMLPDSE